MQSSNLKPSNYGGEGPCFHFPYFFLEETKNFGDQKSTAKEKMKSGPTKLTHMHADRNP